MYFHKSKMDEFNMDQKNFFFFTFPNVCMAHLNIFVCDLGTLENKYIRIIPDFASYI